MSKAGTDIKEFAEAVAFGMSQSPKQVSSSWLYDENGSQLFEQIMDLPEYYLTGCEASVIQMAKQEWRRQWQGKPFNLIELGAGDGRKTLYLLQHLCQEEVPFTYCPVDISCEGMARLEKRIKAHLPELSIESVIGDYQVGFQEIKELPHSRNVVLFLGSTIGNFDRDKAREFLSDLRTHLSPGDFALIGFDLKKEVEIIEAAYDDAQGVTQKFNLNLLKRINRELRGHFDVQQFTHHSYFDPEKGAIQSYVLSKIQQSVTIEKLNMTVDFMPWEPIHIETSHKYTLSSIEKLASEAGFSVIDHYRDPKNYFMDSLWGV